MFLVLLSLCGVTSLISLCGFGVPGELCPGVPFWVALLCWGGGGCSELAMDIPHTLIYSDGTFRLVW